MILAVVAGRGLSLGWLRSRPLAELGVISYGVYLWHVPLILFVKAMTADDADRARACGPGGAARARRGHGELAVGRATR